MSEKDAYRLIGTIIKPWLQHYPKEKRPSFAEWDAAVEELVQRLSTPLGEK